MDEQERGQKCNRRISPGYGWMDAQDEGFKFRELPALPFKPAGDGPGVSFLFSGCLASSRFFSDILFLPEETAADESDELGDPKRPPTHSRA
jgi:hypothetical protein